MSINASTPLGIMGFLFVSLCEKDAKFPASLSQRIPTLSPLLVFRIGAIVEHCANAGVIPRNSVVWSMNGAYPNNLSPAQGSRQELVNAVRLSLKPLRVQATLQQAMSTCVSIQNDAMMLGIGKITDAMDGTLKNLSATYENGKKIWTYGGKPIVEKGPVLKELNAKLINYKGDPVDLFVLAI